jgi:hypothetical protein
MCSAAFVAILGVSVAAAADTGTLKGRFVYKGKAPEPAKVRVDRDAEVFGKLGLVDESLLVDKDGGIANVVLYVSDKNVKVDPSLKDKVPEKLVYDNKDGRFEPHVSTIWLDHQTLVLSNSDPVGHNSNLQPIADAGINPLLAPGSKVEYKFMRQQTVPQKVGCNIHPWMQGYILPRNNPYATVSAEDGTFVIEGLPTGELEFRAWHERPGYLEAKKDWKKGKFTYTVKAGENDMGDIEVPAAVFDAKKK